MDVSLNVQMQQRQLSELKEACDRVTGEKAEKQQQVDQLQVELQHLLAEVERQRELTQRSSVHSDGHRGRRDATAETHTSDFNFDKEPTGGQDRPRTQNSVRIQPLRSSHSSAILKRSSNVAATVA